MMVSTMHGIEYMKAVPEDFDVPVGFDEKAYEGIEGLFNYKLANFNYKQVELIELASTVKAAADKVGPAAVEGNATAIHVGSLAGWVEQLQKVQAQITQMASELSDLGSAIKQEHSL